MKKVAFVVFAFSMCCELLAMRAETPAMVADDAKEACLDLDRMERDMWEACVETCHTLSNMCCTFNQLVEKTRHVDLMEKTLAKMFHCPNKNNDACIFVANAIARARTKRAEVATAMSGQSTGSALMMAMAAVCGRTMSPATAAACPDSQPTYPRTAAQIAEMLTTEFANGAHGKTPTECMAELITVLQAQPCPGSCTPGQ